MLKLAAIALGANATSSFGVPEKSLARALCELCGGPVRLRAASRFFATPAFPPGSGPDFVNAAALVATDLPPEALLAHLHGIEAAFGRERTLRWGPRTLDLDLLLYGDLVLPDAATAAHWIGLPPDRQRSEAPDRLILPHPRLAERAFVLIPLADIAPGWPVPLAGRTVAELVSALPKAAKAEIRPI